MADTTLTVNKYAVLAVPHVEILLKAIAERDGMGDEAAVKSFVQRHTSRAVKTVARAVRDAQLMDKEKAEG